MEPDIKLTITSPYDSIILELDALVKEQIVILTRAELLGEMSGNLRQQSAFAIVKKAFEVQTRIFEQFERDVGKYDRHSIAELKGMLIQFFPSIISMTKAFVATQGDRV